MFLIVTNTGAPWRGRFDGKDYDFPTGEGVPITDDAARHLFGFGLSNKDEVLSRHSWMHKSTDRDAAMERLGQFKFDMGQMQVVSSTPQLEVEEVGSPYAAPEVEEPEEEHGTAPVQMGADGGNKGTDGLGQEPLAPTQIKAPEPQKTQEATTEEPGLHEDVFN